MQVRDCNCLNFIIRFCVPFTFRDGAEGDICEQVEMREGEKSRCFKRALAISDKTFNGLYGLCHDRDLSTSNLFIAAW